MSKPPVIQVYEEIEWDRPLETATPGTRPPEDLVKEAEKRGARRKKLVRGEGGFFMNRSVLPQGFRVPSHSHDHDELMVVLQGSCRFDGDLAAELRVNDSVVIFRHTEYGFTCGAEGMEFLTVRVGESSVDVPS
jgi:quercetin dioxygenase-like cupin family protein